MKLLTAHKILIATAAVFFLFFALREGRGYYQGNDEWAGFRAILYMLVAIGFAIYLKNLKRWYK
jgi:hypothetical protein